MKVTDRDLASFLNADALERAAKRYNAEQSAIMAPCSAPALTLDADGSEPVHSAPASPAVPAPATASPTGGE